MRNISGNYRFECVVDNSFNTDISKLHVLSTEISNLKTTQLGIEIPLAIFRQDLSGLQAIVKYLREQYKKSYADIGKLLGRDQRTIWTEYECTKKSSPYPLKDLMSESVYINSSIFKSRILSVLETVSYELKKRGYANSQIAKLLSKDQRTIWTVLSRAKNKLETQRKTTQPVRARIKTRNTEKAKKRRTKQEKKNKEN